MSDEDRDVDIESDADKRAHHNALERKRRDHIKDSFSGLRDSIPQLQGEKVASRAQILKKAADYIVMMRKKNITHQQDIEDLKKQNQILESQIRLMQKSKSTGEYVGDSMIMNSRGNSNSTFDGGSGTETSDSETPHQSRRNKRLKGNPVSSTSNT